MLLGKGANVDDLVLACAVEKGSFELVQLLLEHGAPLTTRVLFAAAKTWNLDILRRFLDAGAEVNQIWGNMNALSTAASQLRPFCRISEFQEICVLLLDHGANINPPQPCQTALELAIAKGPNDAIEFLIDEGAFCDNESVLSVAAGCGDPRVLEMVLNEASTRPHFHLRYSTSCLGHMALFEAIDESGLRRGNSQETIDILIQRGVNLVTPCAAKALQLVCFEEDTNIELVQLLIYAGIQLDLPEVDEIPPCWKGVYDKCQRHPLQLSARQGQDETMRLLLRYGADPNAYGQETGFITDSQRKTTSIGGKDTVTRFESTLCSAVQSGHVRAVRLLLEAGADVNSPTHGPFGRTALQTAAEIVDMDILEELLRAGADVNADPAEWRGATALQAAAIGGFIGTAARLIEIGADVNAKGAERDGRTALEGASEHGRIDMVQFLLNSGADVQSPNFGAVKHENAVDLARRNGYNAVARLLQKHRESLE